MMIDSTNPPTRCRRGWEPSAGSKEGATTRHLGVAVMGVLVLLVAGCKQIPRQELSQYRAAFAEVEKTSIDILIDFAEALEWTNAQIESGDDPAPTGSPALGAHVFSDELNSFDHAQLEHVEVRRLALRTIDKFNNVLVTLAEGKSIESVQNTAGGFIQAASKFIETAGGNAVPGLSAVTGFVKTIVGQMEQARLRKEFEKAVRDGAPIINRMLAELIAERTEHLDMRGDQATLRQVDLATEITDGARRVIALFDDRDAPEDAAAERDSAAAAAAAAPADAELAAAADAAEAAAANADPRPDLEESLNGTLEPAKLLPPIELAYRAGKPNFGEQDRILAEQVVGQIEASVAAYQANIAQYESLRAALNNYGTMLNKAQTALEILVEALDRPQKFEAISDQLFEIAFSVKRDIEAFKAARQAAQ